MKRGIRIATFAAVLAASSAEAMTQPQVRVAVILDGSGSFRARRQEAVTRASRMLDELAKTKLHRWESGRDEIAVISLDAIPDVLWRGDLRALKQVTANAWAERFAARQELAGCTDVTTAFRMAEDFLGEGDGPVRKYLFVFSDLVSEPPTGSVRSCKPARNLPDEDFPWEQLSDVSVSVFWMPADQKLRWKRTVKEHDLAGSFKLFATGESSVVEVKAPPRPKAVVTQEEKDEAAGKLRGIAWGIGKGMGYLVLFAMTGTGLLVLAKKVWRRPVAR